MSPLPAPPSLSSLSASARVLVERIAAFQQWPDPWDADPSKYRAAVLLPLIPSEDGADLEIILTVRQTKMRRNAGEVAAPGGRFDSAHDKSLVDTALREAYEEIGIEPSSVHVLTTLPTFVSRGVSKGGPVNLIMTPVVGLIDRAWWDRRLLKLNDDEVSAVFCWPLADFLKTNNHAAIIYLWPENPRIVAITHTFATRHLQNKTRSRVLYTAGPGKPPSTSTELPSATFKLSPIIGVTTNICVVAAELAHAREGEFRPLFDRIVADQKRAPGGPPPPLTKEQEELNASGATQPFPFRRQEELAGLRERYAGGPYCGGMSEERKIELVGIATGRWGRKPGATLGEERSIGKINVLAKF
ncbi:hypothetical protein M427DRAFT_155855 [Gonapodya prolifera JEL478]|uniref:Nudix hydrolase domain-containing protein n=1 Tax=Gonapodya prolifera (strain JEL478) TaxID=1344416 RepID=A0A139ADM8_GONPJ|nr:hypothetical protein M427DRAFT_155855 [Gonapodya prolifera JEL478]|eukprot:KXS14523.1 hypothetical protein M427DRAFT_155855 [Gonapodya prolifera JEL478]